MVFARSSLLVSVWAFLRERKASTKQKFPGDLFYACFLDYVIRLGRDCVINCLKEQQAQEHKSGKDLIMQ